MAMRRFNIRSRIGEVASQAALLVMLATVLASLSWISSGKAGGQADDLKAAALGFMILRLEAATEASTALVQAQTYLTQAGMYYAWADSETQEESKAYLNGLGDQSMEMSTFHTTTAQEAGKRADLYFEKYDQALAASSRFGRTADLRSTAALLLNVSAGVASGMVLFKKRFLFVVFAPVFFLGASLLVVSLF